MKLGKLTHNGLKTSDAFHSNHLNLCHVITHGQRDVMLWQHRKEQRVTQSGYSEELKISLFYFFLAGVFFVAKIPEWCSLGSFDFMLNIFLHISCFLSTNSSGIISS